MMILKAFFFCGMVCFMGQWLYDHTKLTPGHITSLFVCIGACLDIFDIYDSFISIFGAGALLPITSFGHSLIHGSLEKASEFGVLGIPMGMFDITAPGIASAIVFAFIMALIFKPKS